MTARQPQRPRRRSARPASSTMPQSTMPQPSRQGAPGAAGPAARPQTARAHVSRMREHHVSKDYGYVHRDLIAIGAIGAAVLAFIVGMSFVI